MWSSIAARLASISPPSIASTSCSCDATIDSGVFAVEHLRIEEDGQPREQRAHRHGERGVVRAGADAEMKARGRGRAADRRRQPRTRAPSRRPARATRSTSSSLARSVAPAIAKYSTWRRSATISSISSRSIVATQAPANGLSSTSPSCCKRADRLAHRAAAGAQPRGATSRSTMRSPGAIAPVAISRRSSTTTRSPRKPGSPLPLSSSVGITPGC